MSTEVISALIGGCTASFFTMIGTFFTPLWQEKFKERRKEKRLNPRKDRLISLLKYQQQPGSKEKYFPQYTIQQLSASVGMSEDDCRELLVKIGAWGGRLRTGVQQNGLPIDEESWTLNPKAFYSYED